MGGLMGKITEVGENFVKVEVADDTIVTIRRSSIEAVMPKGSLKEM
jgi:preprotein translocase subunit YajC